MLDKTGFQRKTYTDVLNDMIAAAEEQLGSDINTDETSILGKYIRINAEQISQLWEDVEGSYFSAFLNTANGVSLDRKMSDYNISRNQAVQATGQVTFTGIAGTVIEIGTQVSTDDDVLFFTTEEVTIGSNGNVTCNVTAEEVGTSGNVAAGEINSLLYPNEYITNVTNQSAISGGREIETDYEFRSRVNDSLAINAVSSIDSIISALYAVSGVRAVSVVNNNTSSTVNSVPAHSFHAIVYGGHDQEIGDAIFSKKPLGIGCYGSISVTCKDINNSDHTVYFSRPTEVNPDFSVTATVTSGFPTDGINQIKDAIIDYVGGSDTSGEYHQGLNMGEDIIYTKLLSKIVNIEGVTDITLTMRRDTSELASSNIAIADGEIAVVLLADITVVTTDAA